MSKKGYEIGNPNVFEDLDIPNAEEPLIKAQLVFKIDTLMKKRRLKQVEAGLYLAFVNLISPRCFAASSGNFPWSGYCVSSSRLIRTSRSSSNRIAIGTSLRRCMCPEGSAATGINWPRLRKILQRA